MSLFDHTFHILCVRGHPSGVFARIGGSEQGQEDGEDVSGILPVSMGCCAMYVLHRYWTMRIGSVQMRCKDFTVLSDDFGTISLSRKTPEYSGVL